MNAMCGTERWRGLSALGLLLAVLGQRPRNHLIALAPAGRSALPRLGDRTVAFVRRAAEYARADGCAQAIWTWAEWTETWARCIS